MRKPKEIKWNKEKNKKSYELKVPYPDSENDVKVVGGYKRTSPATQNINLEIVGNDLRLSFVYAERAYFIDTYKMNADSDCIYFAGVKFRAAGNYEVEDNPKKSLLVLKKELTTAPGLPEKEMGLVRKLIEALEKDTKLVNLIFA